jgi:hypothetical protein
LLACFFDSVWRGGGDGDNGGVVVAAAAVGWWWWWCVEAGDGWSILEVRWLPRLFAPI